MHKLEMIVHFAYVWDQGQMFEILSDYQEKLLKYFRFVQNDFTI